MTWFLGVVCVASIIGATTLLACRGPLTTTVSAGAIQNLAGCRERRSLMRIKLRCRGTLTVLGGPAADLSALCANISDNGALVLVNQPLPLGLEAILNIPALKLVGVGRVRHCHRKRLRYAVGLEFYGPLRRADMGRWTFTRLETGE